MICGWIVFNGECWITAWEKKILDPSYKNGDNLTVTPSIDILTNRFMKLIGIKNVQKINDQNFNHQRDSRYIVPLLVPFISFILFLQSRFPKLHIEYKLILIGTFAIIILINYYKWQEVIKKSRGFTL